jgi:hypothetical protein
MPEDNNPIQVVVLTKPELRHIFNERYWDRIQRHEFREIVHEEHLAPVGSGEPEGTLSQMILYKDWETRDDVVLAHRYWRSDRTIGAFGRPDPRWIVENRIMYTCQPRGITN